MTDKGFYHDFEEHFRGPRAMITERLRVYLPFIQPLRKIYDECPLVDLGCGRGEWLELVTAEGFAPVGVDLDEGMIAACEERGLAVESVDAIAYLTGLADDSLVVVSAFHLVEHLPFARMQELIREALRVLRPAGLLIMETPNPENIRVSTVNFYADPTHIRPINPELLQYLTTSTGFARVKHLRLQEANGLDKRTIGLADVLNAVSPDYAVVAQKDAEANQLVLFDDAFARQYGYSLDDLLEMYRRDSERPLQESVRELDRQVRELLHARQTEFSLVAAETRAAVAEERLRAAEERIEREQKRAETAAEQARQAEAKAVQAEARAQEVDSCAAQAEAREAEAKGQMQQALEAAQQAQELASLAEERLRAVEERVEREQQRAETAVEQARQAETRAVHAAAKAEAAEARAAQAEANLQELRARSEREKQDLAAQGEAALRTAREQVNDLEQELAAMRAKVDELNASSHHWWTEADRLNRELHAIYAGESWKLTYPLRKAKQWVIRLYETLARLARGVKALLQSGTRWAAAFVRRRPKLKAGLLRAVRRVPGLEERLRRLARNAGVGAVYNGSPVSPFTITHTKTSRPTSMEAATPVEGQEADVPGLAAMTPRARCIYHDLKAAIEQQQQRGS